MLKGPKRPPVDPDFALLSLYDFFRRFFSVWPEWMPKSDREVLVIHRPRGYPRIPTNSSISRKTAKIKNPKSGRSPPAKHQNSANGHEPHRRRLGEGDQREADAVGVRDRQVAELAEDVLDAGEVGVAQGSAVVEIAEEELEVVEV